ncbi:MAG: AsnC family transcriptional regulator [Candidatus Lokiarchaeota archaeon]|nr:AsnC family transcriptional regulator [Candidatus Lokiarchaeota archaeon]
MSLSEKFDLDDLDKSIIMILQKNPNITHSEIAKKIGRSQPAVGSRIHKLEDKGVLSAQFGIDFRVANINLIKVEIATRKPEEIFHMAKYCPFIINAMKLSGEKNIMLYMASSSLKKLDNVINYHFRNKDYINDVKMDIVTDYLKPFVLPIDFEMDDHDPDLTNGCGEKCSVRLAEAEGRY